MVKSNTSNPTTHRKLLAAGVLENRKKKFDIIKTFEIFNRENMNVLKEKIVHIILVEADNIFSNTKKMFEVDVKKGNSIQINVINDKSSYDFLSNTWQRYIRKQAQIVKENENNQSSVLN
jgi:phosphotransacetylase